MRRVIPAPSVRASGRLNLRLGFSFVLAAFLATAGCGDSAPGEGSTSDLGENSGLMLPPGFKTVDLPVDKRKDIFREAHRIRALAVQEANAELPMDEAHLPIGDTPAFDKRVADHKAIIERILEKNLAELARKHNITGDDLKKIEQEASLLRWMPPEEPTFTPKAKDPEPEKAKAEAAEPEKKGTGEPEPEKKGTGEPEPEKKAAK